MSMYALQVMTGMEAEITQKLRGKGVDARCPQERRMIRRGGKWQEQLYTLFPSYIFVSTPDVYRVYYAVRHEDGVLHWLGATKGTPEALSAHEEANILWLAGDGPLPPSEAEMQADGTLDFTSGPLAHLKDMLEKVNRHDRRVTVRVPVGGEDKTMPADIGRYIEVFGGAGWVLFGREPSSKVMEVFNDYDAELVNIYRCIKYHPDALQHELDMLPDAREVFFDCRAQEQVRGLTDIQRAARSLYLIKASFGTDRRTFATAPKGVRNISASFPAVQERLRRVIIENLDFEHLIKTYDRENALFYCDPPYVETEKYYRARFQESDHKRLADALHNIKGRFLLSYNDCPQVRELYADCIIEPVSRRNTLSAQSVDGYKEVLVRNYEL